jgi:hypothetical protein
MNFYQFQLNTCLQTLNMANDSLQYIHNRSDRDKRQAANWTRYERCQSKATMFLNQEVDKAYRTVPILLAVDFGVILFFWLLAWFAKRWVKLGFATRTWSAN